MTGSYIVVSFPKHKAEDGGPIVSDPYNSRKEITDQVLEDFCKQNNVDKEDVFVCQMDKI